VSQDTIAENLNVFVSEGFERGGVVDLATAAISELKPDGGAIIVGGRQRILRVIQ
jgi:hypothetical protein